jgi:hypothetical protein
MSSLRPRWTDPVTARRVSKYVKGTKKGDKRESARGTKARGLRHIYCNLYMCI